MNKEIASIIYLKDLGYFLISNEKLGDNEYNIKINVTVSVNDKKTSIINLSTTIKKIIPTTIVTTIKTTIIKTIPTTIRTTIPTTITNVKYNCSLEKCEKCDEKSFSHNLCITCNKAKDYYQISPSINISSYTFNNKIYIDCFNNSTKPSNFYFNKTGEYYEPCYRSCATCEYGGDGNQNNCTTCDVDYK